MNHKPHLLDVAKTSGRTSLHAYTIGVIGQIIGELHTTAESKVVEIAEVLRDLDIFWNEDSLPWNLEDAKKASAATEGQKEITQPKCTTVSGKIASLVDQEWAKEVLRRDDDD